MKILIVMSGGFDSIHLISSRSFNTGKYISLFERLSNGEDKN